MAANKNKNAKSLQGDKVIKPCKCPNPSCDKVINADSRRSVKVIRFTESPRGGLKANANMQHGCTACKK